MMAAFLYTEDPDTVDFVSAGWMVTFVDLLGLLIGMFVLTLSMLDPQRLPISDHPAFSTFREQDGPATNTDYLGTVLRNALNREEEADRVAVQLQKDHIVLRSSLDRWLADRIGPDGTEPAALLRDLSGVLGRLNNHIYIVAHMEEETGQPGPSLNLQIAVLTKGLSVADRLTAYGLSSRIPVLLGTEMGQGEDWDGTDGPLIDIIVLRHGPA